MTLVLGTDIIRPELTWDVRVTSANEPEDVAQRIRYYTGVLWETVNRMRTVTLRDYEITRGCVEKNYLRHLLNKYDYYELDGLEDHELWFAHAVVDAFEDLCP